MRAFFHSDLRRSALEMSAQLWVGTPFRHNSSLCGEGASCVGAVVGVLETACFKVPPYPSGPTNWSKHQAESLQSKWLDEKPEHVASIGGYPEDLPGYVIPGDIVGFQVGNCIHHLGLVLECERFFQCSEALGCVILSQREALFRKRLRRAWRPLEPIEG